MMLDIRTEVVQRKPPKLLRLIGRKYWRHWYVVAYYADGGGARKPFGMTNPYPKAPNPDAISDETRKAIQMLINNPFHEFSTLGVRIDHRPTYK